MIKKESYCELVFLGVAATYPTKERNVSSIYLETHSSKALLDAGEGFQKRLLELGLNSSFDWVFVSHFHPDHVLGIYGFLASEKLKNREKKLTVYCPDKEYLSKCLKLLGLDLLLRQNLGYDLNLKTISDKVIYHEKDLSLKFFLRNHETRLPMSASLTYGIHVYSSNTVHYDKQKLSSFSEKEKGKLFLDKQLVLNDKTLYLKDFIKTEKPPINVIYTSDGTWDSLIIKELKKTSETGLLVSECTHYFEEDIKSSMQKKHTHFSTTIKDLKENCGAIDFIFTHLGAKMTPFILNKILKDKKYPNLSFANDCLRISHNNLVHSNLAIDEN